MRWSLLLFLTFTFSCAQNKKNIGDETLQKTPPSVNKPQASVDDKKQSEELIKASETQFMGDKKEAFKSLAAETKMIAVDYLKEQPTPTEENKDFHDAMTGLADKNPEELSAIMANPELDHAQEEAQIELAQTSNSKTIPTPKNEPSEKNQKQMIAGATLATLGGLGAIAALFCGYRTGSTKLKGLGVVAAILAVGGVVLAATALAETPESKAVNRLAEVAMNRNRIISELKESNQYQEGLELGCRTDGRSRLHAPDDEARLP